jgi:predicted nucleotidyltransferase
MWNSSMKRKDVPGIQRKHEDELREKYGVESVALFGSVARDEAHPNRQ